uniref:Transposase n=1 Tax=Sorangium cellulosum TaxID=56 RepID=A0A3S7V024_SORCE|nr:hypothetical protein [Sorangium cellulosum]
MGRRKRRAFTPEFKAEAVRLAKAGDLSIGQLAKDLDLTRRDRESPWSWPSTWARRSAPPARPSLSWPCATASPSCELTPPAIPTARHGCTPSRRS